MTSYESQIDAQALVDMEAASVTTLNDWFAISGETDKMAWLEKINKDFEMANPDPEPSSITVVDYPEDCDMYSQTMEASMQALQTYADDLVTVGTFNKWINEMY